MNFCCLSHSAGCSLTPSSQERHLLRVTQEEVETSTQIQFFLSRGFLAQALDTGLQELQHGGSAVSAPGPRGSITNCGTQALLLCSTTRGIFPSQEPGFNCVPFICRRILIPLYHCGSPINDF